MRYRFGAFVLDAGAYELSEGDRTLHVEPRVLDLLFFLVRNRDRVVSREELFESVWKTRFISESALSRCILQARKAVSSPASNDEAIKTFHRRGYRFVAAVEELPDVAAPPRSGASSVLDAGAEKLHARAMQLLKKRVPGAMRSAIPLLQEAIELEPAYAAAYAALGECYLFMGFLQQSAPASVYPKAIAALDRATALDPALAEAHAARGFIESVYRWNPTVASEALTTATRLAPHLAIAHHRVGLHLLTQRRFDEAEASLRHAAALDPLSPIFATACGLPAMGRGDPETASAIYRTIIESEPRFFPVHFYNGLALEAAGRVAEAVEELRFAVSVAEIETEAAPALAHALAQLGLEGEAARITGQLREAAARRFISPFWFAVTAIGSRDYDLALDLLRESVTMRAARMNDLHLDPRFLPLHDDSRFQSLLADIGVDPLATASPKWWVNQKR